MTAIEVLRPYLKIDTYDSEQFITGYRNSGIVLAVISGVVQIETKIDERRVIYGFRCAGDVFGKELDDDGSHWMVTSQDKGTVVGTVSMQRIRNLYVTALKDQKDIIEQALLDSTVYAAKAARHTAYRDFFFRKTAKVLEALRWMIPTHGSTHEKGILIQCKKSTLAGVAVMHRENLRLALTELVSQGRILQVPGGFVIPE